MDTCIMDTCIMDTSAWVQGAKDEVKEARRDPKLQVYDICKMAVIVEFSYSETYFLPTLTFESNGVQV